MRRRGRLFISIPHIRHYENVEYQSITFRRREYISKTKHSAWMAKQQNFFNNLLIT